MQTDDLETATDEVLAASRVLVGIAARTIPDPDEVTLAQFRALVLLDAHGGLNPGALAELLGVERSTTTRLCDRLVAKGLIERAPRENRREVCIAVTPAGASLVAQATAERRAEIRMIVGKLSLADRDRLSAGLREFRKAAGDGAAELAWSLGWST
ncbi:MAG: MarR family transcriptional regulator [Actinomycetota bacterium]|nr:MarR family transcriptional regulator [Actinomycetota bacterium]